MLVEKLKRLLLISSVLDQLPNGLEPITAIGVGCLAGLFDFLAGMFVAQVQQAVQNPDRLHAPTGNQSQCPGFRLGANNRVFCNNQSVPRSTGLIFSEAICSRWVLNLPSGCLA